MALAQIIDLEERRRARVSTPNPAPAPVQQPVFYFMWMPVYFWYVA
jgi:hypothetical protein